MVWVFWWVVFLGMTTEIEAAQTHAASGSAFLLMVLTWFGVQRSKRIALEERARGIIR